jgi:hypothetical protein
MADNKQTQWTDEEFGQILTASNVTEREKDALERLAHSFAAWVEENRDDFLLFGDPMIEAAQGYLDSITAMDLSIARMAKLAGVREKLQKLRHSAGSKDDE